LAPLRRTLGPYRGSSPEEDWINMMHSFARQRSIAAALFVGILVSDSPAGATIVRFDTTLGNVDVRLYDTATPLSVANFLGYVTSGRYTDSIIHRSVPGFIIQGGGYYSPAGAGGIELIPESPPVPNEPGISNLRGTLSYAKLGGYPDSATSEWFFNLADNSENLDNQNGGFTVFGRVLGDGMDIVDAIAGLGIVNAGSPFDELPVLDINTVIANGTVHVSDLVFVNSISIRNVPAGDYNGNGIVSATDYAVWKGTFGSTTYAEADGNGDGIVDAADFTVWRDAMAAGSGAIVTAIVPEPSTVMLALTGLAAMLLAGAPRRRA
jgi:cyclophilin family peptidyl-prolyl cis-trans isomerase